jgi:DNA-binding XRE family transcriptional regulator
VTPLDFKLWRVRRGLSQWRAAQLFGVSQQAISHWEKVKLPDNIKARIEAVESPEVRFCDVCGCELKPDETSWCSFCE